MRSAKYDCDFTFGLIDIPSTRLVIVDAAQLPADVFEQLAGVGIVACVSGIIAEVLSEQDVTGDAYRLVIEVLRGPDENAVSL